MLLFLMISNCIALMSNSWLSLWISLELNLLMFIPFIIYKLNSFSVEVAMKYYLIQVVSSFLFIILMIELNSVEMKIYALNFTMAMKMGLAPFHKWLTNLMGLLNWKSFALMMTLQKIIPLWIMSNFFFFNLIIGLLIMINMIVSALGGWNQVNMQKFMFFSSLNHNGWMLSSFLMNSFWWLNYWMIYLLILAPMTYFFNKFKLYNFNQIFNLNYSKLYKMIIMMNLFSFMGMPPFIGFIPKWFLIIVLNKFKLLIIFMLMASLFTFYFYCYFLILFMMNSMKINININLNKFTMFLAMMNPIIWVTL